MGCGGSRARADVVEPRLQESWTRETESTWLTYTEAELPHDTKTYKSRILRGDHGHHLFKESAKVSGPGMEGRSCEERCRRMVNAGSQHGNTVSSNTSTNLQRPSYNHEISDAKHSMWKEGTVHSEGISSHTKEPGKKKTSLPDIEGTL